MTVNNGSISDGNVVYVFSDPVPEGADLKVDTTIGHVSLALVATVPQRSGPDNF